MQNFKHLLTLKSESSFKKEEITFRTKNGHEISFEDDVEIKPSMESEEKHLENEQLLKTEKNILNLEKGLSFKCVENGSSKKDDILALENKTPSLKDEEVEILREKNMNLKKMSCIKHQYNALSSKNDEMVEPSTENKVSLEFSENIDKEIMKHFTCHRCNKSFIRFCNLRKHVENHSGVFEFECYACNKKFISADLLNFHSAVHAVKNFQCETSGQNLGECQYRCDICKAGFNREDAFYMHSHLGHKAKKNQKCEMCGVSFVRKRDLTAHLTKHGNIQLEKKYECMVCKKRLATTTSLRDHMLTHTGEKPWSCEMCSFSFTAKSGLKRHMRTHTGEKPYECNVCLKKFATLNILKNHLRVHTREKPFICDVCKKAFWRKSQLNEHYIIHTGERPHVCDVCGRVFKYPFKLKMHYKTHTQDRKFECGVCKRKFLTKIRCKEHSYSHTGEKPYVCTFTGCGKAFSRSTVLGRHLLIHTGQQPYSCEICKRGFNQKTSLTRHYVVHTQEKPYSCEFCEQSFTQKAYLQFHRRQKHDEYLKSILNE